MKQKQRWLAILLSVLMVWTMLPATGLPAYRVWAAKTVTFTLIYGTAGVSEEKSYDKILDGKKTQDDFSKWCILSVQRRYSGHRRRSVSVGTPLPPVMTTQRNRQKSQELDPLWLQ